MVGFLPVTGENREGSRKLDELRNISESWGISRSVGEGFRGFGECFGGFYKAERGLKNFGGEQGGDRKKSEEKILGGAVRESSLRLCLRLSTGSRMFYAFSWEGGELKSPKKFQT